MIHPIESSHMPSPLAAGHDGARKDDAKLSRHIKRRSAWWRWSIRLWLLLIAGVSVGVAFLADAYEQRQAELRFIQQLRANSVQPIKVMTRLPSGDFTLF